MSRLKVQHPIVHTPSFQKWKVSTSYVDQKVKELGLEPLYPNGAHAWYAYTNEEGVANLLPHLIQSYIYQFTCINYAFRVWNLATELYGLNTWSVVVGRIPDCESRHAWNLIMVGDENGLNLDKFLYFEPNDTWQMSEEIELAYQAFPIGEADYKGEFIFY